MRDSIVILAALACAATANAQSFEASVSGGQAVFPGNSANLGAADTAVGSPPYTMNQGFRLTFRMTVNSYRFFGYEL